MTKEKQRYKVSFEETGIPFCSYTNDIVEAQRYAKEKTFGTDHPISIYDTEKNLVLGVIW